MAFNKEESKVPAAIGDISIVLTDYSGEAQSIAQFEVQILLEDGNIFGHVRGDLVPHITSAQISWLIDFMEQLRNKAVEEIL